MEESFKLDLIREAEEELYEDMEAPKFVDLTAPDLARCPTDDASWFCLRVGCDQNHEQVDPDALDRSFLLRVMAARSPNVRLQKAISRRDQRSMLKCPHSAPAKPPRSRITRLSTATSAADKMARPMLKNHPICSLRASPRQTKANVEASSAKKKALTTPRSKNPRPNQEPFHSAKHQKEPVAAARKATVAKALFMNTPKKASENNASATPLKGRTPVSEVCGEMRKLNLASREVPSRYLCQLSNPKTLKRGEGSATKSSKKRILGNVRKWTTPAIDEESRNGCDNMAAKENSCTAAPSAEESTAPARTEITSSNDAREDMKESRIDAETVQPDNSDDNKENLSYDDKPMEANSNAAHSESESLRLENIENVPQKVAKIQNKVNLELGGKLKKTTNPKPFRLRTDERGILKEANSERKRMLVRKEIGAVPSNGDGPLQNEKCPDGKGTDKLISADKQKKQRTRGTMSELVAAKLVPNSLRCNNLENTRGKGCEKSQKIPKVASSSRRTIKTASFISGNTMPGKEKKNSVKIPRYQAAAA